MTRSRARRRQSAPTALGSVDWLTVFIALGLTLFGILIIFDASNIEAFYQFGNKFHFAQLQLLWLTLGLIAFGISAIFPLPILRKLSPYLFLITIILLIAVLLPGIGKQLQGARRWIFFGPFSLQPSELAKLSALLYFPTILLKKHRNELAYMFVSILVVFLLILEPDLGTSIILVSIALSIYYFAGAPFKKFIPVILLTGFLGLILIITSSYRLQRLKTFFNPTSDPLGTSYHIRQVLISFGSGGLTGTGIGKSRQKYQYLPEATTDSIYAVVAEETGFIGAATITLLYAYLYLRGFSQILYIKQAYPRLVAAGVMGWLSLQTLLNLAAMVVLVPLTGSPLPFISYGGSSLIVTLAGLGLYANASRYRGLPK
jgi:cell division protein FtsW